MKAASKVSPPVHVASSIRKTDSRTKQPYVPKGSHAGPLKRNGGSQPHFKNAESNTHSSSREEARRRTDTYKKPVPQSVWEEARRNAAGVSDQGQEVEDAKAIWAQARANAADGTHRDDVQEPATKVCVCMRVDVCVCHACMPG